MRRLPFAIPGIAINTVFEGTRQELFPEEAALLPPSVSPLREQQFSWGRLAAHQCLRELGVEASPIGRGDSREPIWPHGIVGSISHTESLGGAACGRATSAQSLGFDLHEVRPISANVLRKIASEDEQLWITAGGPDSLLRASTLFSAKESIYKALFPLCRRYIGFLEAELVSFGEAGTMVMRLASKLAQECRVSIEHELLFAHQDTTVATILIIPPRPDR